MDTLYYSLLSAFIGIICLGYLKFVSQNKPISLSPILFWQGDYKCDTPDGADLPETHIAAWDHPSMDYVSKDDENIIFTLCQVSE